MNEWIEDNFGEVERDSFLWRAAVQAFHDHCEEQEEAALEEDLNWIIRSGFQDPNHRLDDQLESVIELLDVRTSDKSAFSLLAMLHGHVIAALELYLASTFIHYVTNSKKLIKKLVETDPEFAKRKFSLKQIFETQKNLEHTVAAHLKDLIFHKIEKVKPMFLSVLGCDFGDVEWLFKAVIVRHDCAHRAGYTIDSERVEISKDSVKDLIDKSKALARLVEATVSNLNTEATDSNSVIF